MLPQSESIRVNPARNERVAKFSLSIYLLPSKNIFHITQNPVPNNIHPLHRGDGYYKNWEEDVLIFSGKKKLPMEEVKQLVTLALKRGLFYKDLYEKYKILTSAGIQRRYLAACEKRNVIHLINQYIPTKAPQESCDFSIMIFWILLTAEK